MLFTFALLIATIPAVTGWGFGAVWLLSKFNRRRLDRFDLLEPIIGLAIVTVVVNLENFFYPVSFGFASVFVLVGWVLFLCSVPRLAPFLTKPFWIGCVLLWLATVSTLGVMPPANYDSGLYHLPAIRWLVDSTVPFGLANLHGRLGFNSAWFSISAVLAQVGAPNTQNYTALASETLFAALGIAILAALYRFVHARARDIATLFLLLSGMIGFSPVVLENLSSPSTDHPVILLSLVLVYVFLRAVEARDEVAFLYEFWLSVLLSLFIITIKVSVLPLALIPISLFWIGYRRRLGVAKWKNLLPTVVTAILVAGSWMARNFVLSGCLIYPLSLTCVPGLPWAVSSAQANSEALWVMSWARDPGNPQSIQVLTHWEWLEPWFGKLIASNDFVVPLICLGVGLVLILVARRKVQARRDVRPLLVLGAISLIGMLYWFLSAPDLRFGSTWFWNPGLLALTVGILVLNTNPALKVVLQLSVIGVLIASAFSVGSVGTSYVRRTGIGYRAAVVAIPQLPKAQAEVKQTTQGVLINVVVVRDRCFWTPICTPAYSFADITFAQTRDNRVYIYPAH